jgi:hypothetical protein
METYKINTVKTITFNIRPFGNFLFKWSKTSLYDKRPNWILVSECHMYHEEAMPLSPESELFFVDLMKKHKTDVFVDDNIYHPTFYTRTNSGITPISHSRITNLWNALKNNNNEQK